MNMILVIYNNSLKNIQKIVNIKKKYLNKMINLNLINKLRNKYKIKF